MYKLIAHRGEKKSSKENTLAAFFDAINADYVGFECDIRMTKDNKIIVFHDPLYKGKLVRNCLYSNMKEDDIPLLESILNIETNKMILIDIKDPFVDIKSLLILLNHYKTKKIYLMSYYDSVIKKLNSKDRNYKLGILNYVINTNDNYIDYDFLCMPKVLINELILNRYKKAKKEVFIYGIKQNNIKDLYPYYIVD